MPIYEYLCDNCGRKVEIIQGIKARPKKKCPACGKQKLKRMIGSGVSLIFKGSGFYCTDYKNK